MDGIFRFKINSNDTSAQGIGYTELLPSGNNTNLGRSKVIAHMDSGLGSYDLEFIMESYADFLTVKIKNFRPS